MKRNNFEIIQNEQETQMIPPHPKPHDVTVDLPLTNNISSFSTLEKKRTKKEPQDLIQEHPEWFCSGRGDCLVQLEDCSYVYPLRKCPLNCFMKQCSTCKKSLPQLILDTHGGRCIGCAIEAHSRQQSIKKMDFENYSTFLTTDPKQRIVFLLNLKEYPKLVPAAEEEYVREVWFVSPPVTQLGEVDERFLESMWKCSQQAYSCESFPITNTEFLFQGTNPHQSILWALDAYRQSGWNEACLNTEHLIPFDEFEKTYHFSTPLSPLFFAKNYKELMNKLGDWEVLRVEEDQWSVKDQHHELALFSCEWHLFPIIRIFPKGYYEK